MRRSISRERKTSRSASGLSVRAIRRNSPSASLQSNAVVRWEYHPGSAPFPVWQQGRRLYDDETRDAGNLNLRSDSYRLFEQHPDNVVLVKASYWFSL